jgi:hypothetical protein
VREDGAVAGVVYAEMQMVYLTATLAPAGEASGSADQQRERMCGMAQAVCAWGVERRGGVGGIGAGEEAVDRVDRAGGGVLRQQGQSGSICGHVGTLRTMPRSETQE